VRCRKGLEGKGRKMRNPRGGKERKGGPQKERKRSERESSRDATNGKGRKGQEEEEEGRRFVAIVKDGSGYERRVEMRERRAAFVRSFVSPLPTESHSFSSSSSDAHQLLHLLRSLLPDSSSLLHPRTPSWLLRSRWRIHSTRSEAIRSCDPTSDELTT